MIPVGIEDNFGRSFRYLRVSITDACNFSCAYCLPNGYCKEPLADPPLRVEEFANLVAGFADLGVRKIRLTGGEPTLRRDLLEFVKVAVDTPGIEDVALSTNGYRLASIARDLKDAGLKAVNVSVDSLDEKTFQTITKSPLLPRILEGIEACLSLGLRVKLNAVLMRDFNDNDLPRFLQYIEQRPVSVRFIELMQTGDNKELFSQHHVSAEVLEEKLKAEGWTLQPRGATDGPAREYRHLSYEGQIGVIAPYSHDFCGNCNRLRISCRGELKLCLFGDGQHSVRAFIQKREQASELHAAIFHLLKLKLATHSLHEGQYGNTYKFSSIGG
jgi:cyclic pyranopterin phosphate synthase